MPGRLECGLALSIALITAARRRRETQLLPLAQTEMTHSGNFAVFENIVNNTPGTYSVVIFLGGGQAGVIGAGFAHALQQEGLVDNVNAYIGLSSGSAAVYAIATDSVEELRSIYYEDNIRDNVFDFKRPWNIFARDRLERAFRKRNVNQDSIKDKSSQLLVGVTDINTGEGMFVDLKSQPDPLRAVLASLSTPLADQAEPITINGRQCKDGALVFPNPLHEVARKHNAPDGIAPTDILIVDTGPFDSFTVYPEKIAFALESLGIRTPTLRLLKRRRFGYMREIPYMTGEKQLFNWQGDPVRVAVFHPAATPVGMFTKDPELLRAAEHAANQEAHRLFGLVTTKKLIAQAI